MQWTHKDWARENSKVLYSRESTRSSQLSTARILWQPTIGVHRSGLFESSEWCKYPNGICCVENKSGSTISAHDSAPGIVICSDLFQINRCSWGGPQTTCRNWKDLLLDWFHNCASLDHRDEQGVEDVRGKPSKGNQVLRTSLIVREQKIKLIFRPEAHTHQSWVRVLYGFVVQSGWKQARRGGLHTRPKPNHQQNVSRKLNPLLQQIWQR